MALLFVGLVGLSCSGVWTVDYYFNQDGSPHLYNAYLILEILKGNASILQFASLNPHLVPNLTGHWILAFLLIFFEPATTTKIMVTMTFALFVGSVGWLRYQVAGREGMGTALLLATALAFNWMWFLGFYNYVLAASCFSFSLGFWWRWREGMNSRRSLILFLLLVFTFCSHLISFGLLVAALAFLLTVNFRVIPRKSVVWTLAILLSTTSLIINYLYWSRSGGAIEPEWTYLKDPLSISNWGTHFFAADPFSLISRKAAPFIDFTTPVFTLFSSALWLELAIFLLVVGTLGLKKTKIKGFLSEQKSWGTLAVLFTIIWAVGPDGFGKVHGGFLRERTLLLAAACFVPFFRPNGNFIIRVGSHACLIFVILFQTLVLCDYAHYAEPLGKQILEARNHIGESDSLASIVFMDNTRRFRPMPLASITPLLGVDRNGPVWDNFEFGNYYFPVIAKTPDERQFVSEWRESNTFDLADANDNTEERLEKLKNNLSLHHQEISVLLIWNDQANRTSFIEKWYQKTPYFESGNLRLYKHL